MKDEAKSAKELYELAKKRDSEISDERRRVERRIANAWTNEDWEHAFPWFLIGVILLLVFVASSGR